MTADVDVLSAIALKGAFEATVLPEFERASSLRVRTRWNPTTLLVKEVMEGGRADVLIAMDPAMDDLTEKGILEPAGRVALATALLGVSVLRGAPKPDIGTTEAFRRTLIDARSVAYSRSGASGLYFDKLIERLGVAEDVRRKATIIPSGFTAERLVAGEADIAIQQLSELIVVEGTEIVGPFPADLQEASHFSAARFREAANPAGADLLLAAFATDEAMAAYRAAGLEPRRPS